MIRPNSSSALAILGLFLSWQRHVGGFSAVNWNSRQHSTALGNSSFNGEEHDDASAIMGVGRRDLLVKILGAASVVAFSTTINTATASALDFDAFESNQISADSAPFDNKLNEDEALCKYGAPGKQMGEACERAKMKRKLPGGVDVSGKVDRGDYLKCRYEYPDMVKTRVCKPSSEW